jgi:hypothetical protein
MKTFILSVLALFLIQPVSALAQTSIAQSNNRANAGSATANLNLFPLEEVRAGQRGVARTVFSGTEPEEFNVEILGVMPGYPAPGQSAIIARLSGGQIGRTGVFAGMSGSPVFIDGRLVGAIAFTFPFSREPIAGITPIRQMIDIFETAPPRTDLARRTPRTVSFAELTTGSERRIELPRPEATSGTMTAPVANADSPLTQLFGQQFAPISTPLAFGGISNETLARFAPQLQANHLLPVAGVGGAAPITPLAPYTDQTLLPGSSVSVQLVRGDYSIAASGTVTLRNGTSVYAFGHPFLSLGLADMPMSEASVVSVIPNQLTSFKLSVPGQMVGAISQDRSTGIFGTLGHAPRMIPVRIRLRTSRGQERVFNYEVANDENLTPLLMNLTVYNTLLSNERGVGESTVSLRGQINVAGHQPIVLNRRFSAQSAGGMTAGWVTAPMTTLLTSGFNNVTISGVTLDITAEDGRHTGTLERIAVNRSEVRRGETIEAQAYIRTQAGALAVERVTVRVPTDAPLGQLMLFVGDGGALQQISASHSFTPQTLSELIEVMNRLEQPDQLYAKLFSISPGVRIGASDMPNLPPSVLATLDNDRAAGGQTGTILAGLFETQIPTPRFVVSGQQMIVVNVVR